VTKVCDARHDNTGCDVLYRHAHKRPLRLSTSNKHCKQTEAVGTHAPTRPLTQRWRAQYMRLPPPNQTIRHKSEVCGFTRGDKRAPPPLTKPGLQDHTGQHTQMFQTASVRNGIPGHPQSCALVMCRRETVVHKPTTQDTRAPCVLYPRRVAGVWPSKRPGPPALSNEEGSATRRKRTSRGACANQTI
jgi:hypothetical protein